MPNHKEIAFRFNRDKSILPEKNFIKHKLRNLPLHDKYISFNSKKADTILNCGVNLWFALKEHTETKEQKIKLQNMYTCKDRFCPFCNWRRSLKYSKMIYNFIQQLQIKRKLRFIFLTLTVRNCDISDLRFTIKEMQKAFSNMTKTIKFKNSILGFLRVLEFTIQKDNADMTHPHFHILLAVPPKYFATNENLYLKKTDWSKMWQQSLKVDYEPVVDVRVIKPNKDKSAVSAVIAEISKYPLKDTDISRVERFEELTKQLKGVRNINAGGIFKGALSKTAKIDDDLVHISDEEKPELWIILEELLYRFENKEGKMNYYKVSHKKFSKEDKKEVGN